MVHSKLSGLVWISNNAQSSPNELLQVARFKFGVCLLIFMHGANRQEFHLATFRWFISQNHDMVTDT